VKTDFGTGCLKITPGHDPNDFEIGRRHGLGEIGVIGEDGRMNEESGAYAGERGRCAGIPRSLRSGSRRRRARRARARSTARP